MEPNQNFEEELDKVIIVEDKIREIPRFLKFSSGCMLILNIFLLIVFAFAMLMANIGWGPSANIEFFIALGFLIFTIWMSKMKEVIVLIFLNLVFYAYLILLLMGFFKNLQP